MTLNIIIPVFNEEKYIQQVLESVVKVELPFGICKNLIIVNDGSSDRSSERIEEFLSSNSAISANYIKKNTNKGKGSAVIEAFAFVRGEMVIIHDGDLEYDPSNWAILINEFLNKEANLVIGNRFGLGSSLVKNKYYYGNKFITRFFNAVSKTKFRDVETCSKLFKASMVHQLSLKEKRFGFEIEFMKKSVKLDPKAIREVDINYNPRNRSEGKKIGIIDGLRALYCIVKY